MNIDVNDSIAITEGLMATTASYPDLIYSPRVTENQTGVVYDESNKIIGFAEDIVKLVNEVVSIETELGVNAKGSFNSVEDRLSNLLLNIVEDTTPQLGSDLDVNGNDIVSLSNGDINLIPDGTGKVGVGTTSPDSVLTISGSGTGSTYLQHIQNTTGAGAFAGTKYSSNPSFNRAKGAFGFLETNGGAHFTGDFIFALDPSAGDAFEVDISTNEVMRIKNNGNVGIGTNAPLTTLQVAGDLTMGDTGQQPKVKSFNGNSFIQFESPAANDILFSLHDSGDVMLLESSTGFVGIGTSTPDGNLHVHKATAGVVTASTQADELVVETDVTGGISILTPDNQFGALFIGSPSDTQGAFFNWNHGSLTSFLGTQVVGAKLTLGSGNGAVAMTLDASQNVGIGTTSPEEKLHVAGNVLLTNNQQIQWDNAAGTAMRTLDIDDSDNLNIGRDDNITATQLFGAVNIFDDAGSPSRNFTFTSTGELGIGIADPATNLDIGSVGTGAIGTIAGTSLYLRNGTGSGHVSLMGFGPSGVTNLPAYIGYENQGTAGSTNGDLIFATRSVTTDTVPTIRMRINTAGDIIIPGAAKIRLDNNPIGDTYIDSASNQITLFAAGNMITMGAGIGEVAVNDAGVDLNFRVEGDTDTHAFFVDAGTDNVGIGNSSPNHKLEVTGGVGLQRTITAKTTNYPVTTSDSNTLFTNEGAGGTVIFSLPTAVAGLTYEFYIQANQTLTIDANTGDTIRNAATVSASSGNISNNTVGNLVKLVAINATEWITETIIGTWTIT